MQLALLAAQNGICVILWSRVRPGDKDAGQWSFGGHVFRRNKTSLSHSRQTEKEGMVLSLANTLPQLLDAA